MNSPGHWYCLHCHRQTELNMDREMNVCGHCGSAFVKYVTNVPEPLSKERLSELMAELRESLGKTNDE